MQIIYYDKDGYILGIEPYFIDEINLNFKHLLYSGFLSCFELISSFRIVNGSIVPQIDNNVPRMNLSEVLRTDRQELSAITKLGDNYKLTGETGETRIGLLVSKRGLIINGIILTTEYQNFSHDEIFLTTNIKNTRIYETK